ncbi:nucleotide exchange factor GrpE [Dictyobacter arantiisoli]|uniref:Protein GrpE n=1 Tax=Dictyobacter arantiisoli TaxID=2014874 RepID=A0A5A5TAC9_9CHLR|nr:nucleotide exchange factor GrpE [Dictyobacter arantiisoli]GCF08470.1 protein GrpE [Dictyobacter arantiisoli]
MQQNEAEQPITDNLEADTVIQDNEGENIPPYEQQLAEEQRKANEYLDLLRRTQADFINYKRRVAQEQAEARSVAQSAVIERLLPVLDDLGRVMASVPEELTDNPWAQGVLLSSRQLLNTIEQLGVRPLGAPGEPFDPYKHEALMRIPRSDMTEGTIIEVIRPGYTIGERILRPAQVIVSSAPTAEG